MQTVTVNKERLLEALRTNKKEHREVFLKAQEGYRAKVIEVLDQRLKDAREGNQIDLMFRLPEPRDYTEEYEQAIQMTEWSVGDEVEISQDDFRRYVLNDWEWKHQFVASTQAYVRHG